MSYDLDPLPFDDWIKFTFDHPVVTDSNLTYKQKHWFCHEEWHFEFSDGSKQAENCIRLFRNPEFLKNKFPWEQIEEGFWFLNNEIVLYLLHDEKISWSIRKDLIESMIPLYEKLFRENPLTISGFMWWDGLCYDYFMKKGISKTEDEKNVQNVAFETLKKILDIDSLKCQIAALHGLGHVMHQQTKQVIEDFLNHHPNFSGRFRSYAEGCINGTMDRMGDPNFY